MFMGLLVGLWKLYPTAQELSAYAYAQQTLKHAGQHLFLRGLQ